MYFNSLVNPCWCNWWNYCIQNEAELNVVDNVQKYTWKHMCIHSRGFPVTSVECLELWCHLKSPQRLSSWSWSDIKAAKNWDKCGSFESRGSQFNQRCYWLDKRLMLSDFSSLYCRMLQWSSYFKYIFFSQQAFKVKCNFLWFFFFLLYFLPNPFGKKLWTFPDNDLRVRKPFCLKSVFMMSAPFLNLLVW